MNQIEALWISESKIDPEYLRFCNGLSPLTGFQFDLTLICQFTALQHLNIRESGLTCLPEEISNLGHLFSLHLCGNKLDRLPKSFGQLRIANLNLSHNQFTKFPTVLCDMMTLNNLNLSYNQLKRVPHTRLHLMALAVCHNQIAKIPKWIQNCEVASFVGNPCVVGTYKPHMALYADRVRSDQHWDLVWGQKLLYSPIEMTSVPTLV